MGSAAVVLSTFQEARYFTPARARRHAALAEDVAARRVGRTVLAPHFAAAIVADDRG
ncbi:MAG TPA: hypothetical protein VHM66_05570 [Solirubrobacterales bacterium]|nr:hypothetical protein [Solirubrobacterales bacterium]